MGTNYSLRSRWPGVPVVVPVVHCRIRPYWNKAAALRAAAPGRASRRACGPAGPVAARRGGHSAYDRHCLHDLPRVADHIDDTNSDRLLREIPFTPSQSPPQALGNVARMRPYGESLPHDLLCFPVLVSLGKPNAEPVRNLLIRTSSSNSTSPPPGSPIKIASLLGGQSSLSR